MSGLNSVYWKTFPSLPLKLLFLLPSTYAEWVGGFQYFYEDITGCRLCMVLALDSDKLLVLLLLLFF